MKNFNFLAFLGIAAASPFVFASLASAADATSARDNDLGCYAFTACPYGPPISCEAYGDGCTWVTVPGYSVQCNGFDYYGRWVNLYLRCY